MKGGSLVKSCFDPQSLTWLDINEIFWEKLQNPQQYENKKKKEKVVSKINKHVKFHTLTRYINTIAHRIAKTK